MNTKLQTLILCILFYQFYETRETVPHVVHNRYKKCFKCPPGWGVARICTTTDNTICQQCANGKTYSSGHSSKSPCWLCSKCGIGLYEAHRCTPIRDTVCDECISYIDHDNFTKPNDFMEKCSYMFLKR